MYAMKNEPAPRLINNKKSQWSNEFLHFVNERCLVKNALNRADTHELLTHPFMQNADDEEHKD